MALQYAHPLISEVKTQQSIIITQWMKSAFWLTVQPIYLESINFRRNAFRKVYSPCQPGPPRLLRRAAL